MNRREFLSVLGGTTVIAGAGHSLALSTGTSLDRTTTPLYVKGLVLLDLDQSGVLRLGFPKAPGHKATLSILPENGSRRLMTIKGHGSLQTSELLSSQPRIFVPELVRMKEFYGPSVKSKVDQCPTVITIPHSAIRSVTTAELSKARYTFMRADNGQEVETFRPRQLAETLKIDLSSAGILKLDNGKISIPLEKTQELRVEYAPDSPAGMNAYADHFQHFFSYVERPAALDFDVVPKKLGGGSSSTPRIGHHFMMRFGDEVLCIPAAI
jgi:hypothetical protein